MDYKDHLRRINSINSMTYSTFTEVHREVTALQCAILNAFLNYKENSMRMLRRMIKNTNKIKEKINKKIICFIDLFFKIKNLKNTLYRQS